VIAKEAEKPAEAPASFAIPDHLRMHRNDTDKLKLQKRKKVKALKYEHKQTIERTEMGRVQ